MALLAALAGVLFSSVIGRPPELPPDGEHPNFIRESLPNANIADTGSEEVEIETGISIMDRAILRYLGLVHTGTQNAFIDALTGTAASTQLFALGIQTRTGEQFNTSDPELVDRLDFVYRNAGDADAAATEFVLERTFPPKEGQLVASPRLVFRQDNDLGQTVNANDYQVRLAYEFEQVTTATFLQLAEMQADIFLV